MIAAWLVYGTVTIDPFRWGLFAEELIIAACALLALRLLCVIRLPNWVSLVSIILPPVVIVLIGALHLPEEPAAFERALCLAAAAVFALLTAQQMDNKPDGVLLTALLIGICLPLLFAADTRMIDELARALIAAGVFMAVLAVRQKTAWLAYLASAAFALAGAAGLFAAFAGLGAGVGALLLSPKRKRGGWTLAVVLDFAALPAREGGYGLIVSNPPYVSAGEYRECSREVRAFEPASALTPGETGLEAVPVVARAAFGALAAGGWVLVEIGWKQGGAAADILTACGFAAVAVRRDLAGCDRVVEGRRPG